VWSKNIVKLAEENNGKVIPFFKWSFNNNFYSYLLPNRGELIRQKNIIEKKYDVGFYAGLGEYDYPKPNRVNDLVSWQDARYFGIGVYENTGFYSNTSRKDIHDKFVNQSRFKIRYSNKLEYAKYLVDSLSCKTIFNPPGIGEYTSRMMDQCCLGNCIVLRKTSYDQGNSWKKYLPEVDLKKIGNRIIKS
jgi:hypothetical protein